MKLTNDQVQQFLDDHFSESVSDITVLSGGEWSQAFAFSRGSKAYVIRFGAHVDDYKKDQIAAGFASDKLPVPNVTEIGEAFDAYFVISERAYGEMLDELDPKSMRAIVPAVLDLLDAMREIDVSKLQAQLDDPHKNWRQYLLSANIDDPTRRVHGWRVKLATSKVGEQTFNKAYAALEQLAKDCPEEKHLIHNDLLYRNVLVKNNKISAVIDWGNAIYGDFLYDLAWLSFWSFYYSAMNGINWEAEAWQHYDSIGLIVPNFKKRLLCYKLHIGIDALIYNAFKERWDQLAQNAKKIIEIMEQS